MLSIFGVQVKNRIRGGFLAATGGRRVVRMGALVRLGRVGLVGLGIRGGPMEEP